jgi:hypothetical protein
MSGGPRSEKNMERWVRETGRKNDCWLPKIWTFLTRAQRQLCGRTFRLLKRGQTIDRFSRLLLRQPQIV